jgi:hypothetical protein
MFKIQGNHPIHFTFKMLQVASLDPAQGSNLNALDPTL